MDGAPYELVRRTFFELIACLCCEFPRRLVLEADLQSEDQAEELTDVFHLLDVNGDGFLDVGEFVRFGRALTGEHVTFEDAKLQLSRADANRDGRLSLDEWLAYSRFLARTPDFFSLVDGLKHALAVLDDELDRDAREFSLDTERGRSPARSSMRGPSAAHSEWSRTNR